MKFKWLKNKELPIGRINPFYIAPDSFESLMVSNLSVSKKAPTSFQYYEKKALKNT